MTFLESVFRNNSEIGFQCNTDNIASIKNGAAIHFFGLNLIIDKILSIKNCGQRGGLIFVDSFSSEEIFIKIQNSIFLNNIAFSGSVISFSKEIKRLLSLIANNYFKINFGSSMKKIDKFLFMILSWRSDLLQSKLS